MENLDRSIALFCPLCGNSQFSLIDGKYQNPVNAPGNARLKCSDCKSIYTKDEILAANAEKLDIATEEIVQDAMQEFRKELRKVFEKWK